MTASFCELVPHRPISAPRMCELEAILSNAGRLAAQHQSGSGMSGVSDFFAEFLRAYSEGAEVCVGHARIPPKDAATMIQIKEVESEVLAGFSRLISSLARRASKSFGVDLEDLHGEAFVAFFGALVHYSGESKLSTFLHVCIRRHFMRSCSNRSGLNIPQQIRMLTMRVVDRMGREGVSFDQAVESEGMSQRNTKKVVAAMSRVRSASELDIKESEMASSVDRPSFDGVRKVIDSVKLGNLERAVLEGFLDAPTGEMGLSKGCAGMINPETGRPYSRAALSEAWKRARQKLSVVLKEVA